MTHICIGQQSLLHSTGSDPAPTVAHALPRDSSGAPLAPPSHEPNTNHCPRSSTSGRPPRACSRPHASPRRTRARHAAQTPYNHRGYHRDEVCALARALQASSSAAARQRRPSRVHTEEEDEINQRAALDKAGRIKDEPAANPWAKRLHTLVRRRRGEQRAPVPTHQLHKQLCAADAWAPPAKPS